MVNIKKADIIDKELVSQVVDIHMATFQGFFLTFLGKGFLRQMYTAYVRHEDSDLLIAVDGDMVVGFLAYSNHLSQLYKHMIKKSLFPFAWYSLGAFLRKPKIFMRLIRALSKPGETAKEEKFIHITSIGVSPEYKGRGVGSVLLDSLKSSVNFEKYQYISLETDAVNNESAIRFYEKNGFTLVREFTTREGREMREYQYAN
ncbi:MAG: GNAT family N-acetyltransferase [Clostridia bacterium]|nr:GNAT family N-acetyltransferase [Clostridia bacterium]